MKHIRRLAPVLLLVMLSAGVVVACKQAEGERCQVTSDCEDGLTCNQGTNPPTCQGGNDDDPIDAVAPDVVFEDAPVDMSDADAGGDATPDTTVN